MADYDISEAFGRIEDELISSMIRNFDRHRTEETDYGYNWAQWQAEQLRSLEKYRRDNQKKFGPIFRDLNVRIEQAIREMDRKGGADAEKEILRQIQAGYTPPGDGTKGVFFKTNQRKLNALVKATTDDMSKAETAILRMANDQYRKAIFNAQVYANSGAGTYEKAVDMATKDMAAAGLNCVEYKNGARHRLEDYADMAIRTANKRAYLYGEGERRKAWGVTTVIVNKRTDACPQCLPFCGKVFIDDVWSGGTAKDGDYPLISEAMAKGLYHPRCRCAHTTYFPGISTANDKWTKEELKAVKRNEAREVQKQYAQRQAEKWQRIAETRLDPENQKQAVTKTRLWKSLSKAYMKTGGIDEKTYIENERLKNDVYKGFNPIDEKNVVNILRNEYSGWVEGLSEDEKESIAKYTKNIGDKKPNRLFERINKALRTYGKMTASERRHSDNISNALKRAIAPSDIRVYRGSNFDPTSGYKIGEPFRMDQFISTSVISTRALKGTYTLEILIHKGQSGAAYIESISRMKNQRELLLDKDCFYRVLSRQGTHIVLEVAG